MQLKRRKEGGHEKFPSLWKPNQKARSLYRFTQSLHPIHFHWLSLAPDPKRETSLSNEIPDPRMPYRWNLQVLTSRSSMILIPQRILKKTSLQQKELTLLRWW
ncbi:hypothetical protein PIB30_109724 [Stylosanthes scabra]|uniref:Uncharacterized protein n=1 Tax=Stylosanthes scabra TaxID=79078 RepID=A0ABU6Y257_9FABA|nr:hypothetical protein [Stylosanthes scabra]